MQVFLIIHHLKGVGGGHRTVTHKIKHEL